GWPWQWFAFSSPVSLSVFVLLLLGLVPVLSPAPSALRAALSDTATTAQRQRGTTLPEWSHLILTRGVISLVFLGGPRVPGFAAADPAASAWLQLAAALLFQAKAIAVMSCVLVLRFATGQVRISELAGLGVRFLLPAVAGLLVANYFWAFGGQSPIFAAARVPLSYGLFFLCFVCVAHVVVRVAGHLAGERPRSAVNPWL
ncbi:MAG TPA: NADH-quinone oxidoreductase subunit H, partial [Polyangiaceae bacterium]|nr:NADH-quinone oxidoreductase subunit H [Polyangiaceae bacterium]